MAESNGGKWQLAFWVITGFFVIVSSFIGNAVIANDTASRQRDTFITETVNENQMEIVQRLARIETKIDGK